MTQAQSGAASTQEMNCPAVVLSDDSQKTANAVIPVITAEIKTCQIVADAAVGELQGQRAKGETIQALPPPPANLAGTSCASGKNFNVTVSNKAGYMCHVHVKATWPVSPEVPFAIFTHPDNSALFRDVQRVGERKVLKTEPGYKEVKVEQLGDIQILWIHRTYSTWLHVVEDSRDPECLIITFELIKSDVLGKFSGRWELRPVRDSATGRVVGCLGELNQDVLPKGMPSFMARLPLLGGALRGISVRAVTRVLEDFDVVMEKVRAGHVAGRSTESVLRELCGPVSEAAHANGAVASFAFDPAEDEEEEEEEAGGNEGRSDDDQAERQEGKVTHSGEAEAVSKPAPAGAAEAATAVQEVQEVQEVKLGAAKAGPAGGALSAGQGAEVAVVSAATAAVGTSSE